MRPQALERERRETRKVWREEVGREGGLRVRIRVPRLFISVRRGRGERKLEKRREKN